MASKTGTIQVLKECSDKHTQQLRDYQNANSRIRAADYYPQGIATLLDIVHAKTLRLQTVVEAMQSYPDCDPSFDAIEECGMDIIHYASLLVAYSRHQIDGQNLDADVLNRKYTR